jgi:uncharacterized protein YgbK (DUF1537 family)
MLLLADDATGALECGSILASAGKQVRLWLRPEPPDVIEGYLVADTETRHLSPGEAAGRITRWVSASEGLVYKKTDSALRGNIAAELTALHQSAGWPIHYVPAYPALGRTVIGGRLYVHGTPLHLSDFARDPHHPARTSVVGEAVPAPGVVIHDAATNADLASIAASLRKIQTPFHLAGPAGFLRHWIASAFTWLIVCGSLHPASRRQARRAAEAGLTVLATPAEPEPRAMERLIERAADHVRRNAPGGVIVFGGETAFALWRALEVDNFQLLPEVLPGVAACRAGETVFVTKAGGFGDDGLVDQVIGRFAGK